MATWLVTGGAGFIGSNFVRHALAETPHRIVILDKLTYAGHLENLEGCLDHERVRFVQADISDRSAVEAVFVADVIDTVLNFAAETHVDRSIDEPRTFVRTNVQGTLELLEASRAAWSSRPERYRGAFRFLHVSTDEVFGSLGPRGAFSEESPYDPRSPYAASKAGADHLVHAYHETYGLPTLLTNCSNNYGPYQYPEKLIPLALLNACEGRSVPVYGDGGNVRDWLYVGDHCRALLHVLEQGRPGASYNIGGRCEVTNLELIERLCDTLEEILPAGENALMRRGQTKSYRDLIAFVPDRPGHDRRYAIEPSRIEEELGWRAGTSLAQGLSQTVRWYLENRDWCAAVSAEGARERRGLSRA